MSDVLSDHSQWICPRTRVPLRLESDHLEGAGVRYPLFDGVPDFIGGQSSVGPKDVQTDYVIARRRYEGFARRTHGPIVQRLEDDYLERGHRALQRELDVLDVGCGGSKFMPGSNGDPKASLSLFMRHARSYTGIDPSWEMLNIARSSKSLVSRLRQPRLARSVAEALPFADASFDLVFVKSTLDHCADSELALSEFKRVLRPEGFLLITLQNFASWQRLALSTLMPRRYASHRKRDHHTSPFDPTLLRTRLAAAGFEITELREMGYLHLSRYRLAWLENLIFGLPRLLSGDEGVVRCVELTDGVLARLAPNRGAVMMCWAHRQP